MVATSEQNDQTKGLENWKYQDDIFPMVAQNRLGNTWKLFEAWLRILQLIALLGVLGVSMVSFPEVMRGVEQLNFYQHAPALTDFQDWLLLAFLPCFVFGGTSGVVLSLICLPASRRRALVVGFGISVATTGWLYVTTAPQNGLGGSFGLTTGMMSAIWVARPMSRALVRLLLPPASRWHIAWLWTADGLRVPGAQRNSS